MLPLDPLGGDFEGLVVDPADGSFWMCDEYRPALYHFDATGTLIQRYVRWRLRRRRSLPPR
ncbi:MAG: esterase-like activity of phytase family protein [Verrucomicrobiales bacterium]|nr:esterase-like activity of phytase family protein [Verrucomicrobiales bacterium]